LQLFPLLDQEGLGEVVKIEYIFNNKDSADLRRNLRKNMPITEVVIWQRIRAGQLGGYKFKRQYSAANFILDFYCPLKRLAIELDGESHYLGNQKEYDKDRTKYLNSLNIKVVRFTNKEVMENIEGVIERILSILNEPTSPSLS